MKIESKIALKYLIFSNPNSNKPNIAFQTFFAVVSVIVGILTLLLTFTILNGFENEIITKIQKFSSHIQISLYDNSLIKNNNSIIKGIKSVKDEIEFVSYESATEGIILSDNSAEGIILKGVEPYFINNILGKYLKDNLQNEKEYESEFANIIIGEKLLQKLNMQIGDTVAVSTIKQVSNKTEITNNSFIISTSYKSGMAEFDDINCYVELKKFQKLFAIGNSFNEANIYLKDPTKSEIIAANILKNIPSFYSATTFRELHRSILSWIQLQKGPTPLILSLIMIVGIFNIIGSQLLILLHRISNLGLLRAIGLSKKSIQKIFIIQGMIIGIIGTIVGNILALLFSFVQLKYKIISLPSDIYLMDKVPILIDWEYYLFISVITILLSTLASWIPAKVSGKYSIINSLRYS